MLDHSPVVMTISEIVVKKENIPKLINNKTNWNIFCQIIEENINLQALIRNPEQLEDETDRLIKSIQAQKSTPASQKKINTDITYPVEVRELVRRKRKARKKWQRSRAPENKTILNNLSNELKLLIKKIKNESINRYLQGLSAEKDTEYFLWKATKGLKRPKIQISPIRKDDTTWARSSKQKAKLFAMHLEETF